jgi:hypothetical protein
LDHKNQRRRKDFLEVNLVLLNNIGLDDTHVTPSQKKSFAIQDAPVKPSVIGLLSFKRDSVSTLGEKEVVRPPPPLPTFNTPASDAAEEELRTRLLSNLVHGNTVLSRKFSDYYILGDLLGDGAFGFVFSARRRNSHGEVAVKFIIRSKVPPEHWDTLENGDSVPREICVLRSLRHPNVIEFIDYTCEEEYILLITELFGTQWDASNRELTPFKNPGLKFKYRPPTVQAADVVIKQRTSCDLFECIDARIELLTRHVDPHRQSQISVCSDSSCVRIFASKRVGAQGY